MKTKVSRIITYSILLVLLVPLLISSSSILFQSNKPGRAYVDQLLDQNKNDFGFTKGNFTVSDNGAATYEIPLMTPPGTAGMAPKLSIVYNSQAANGLLGDSWNLNGLSIISRAPATMAQDDFIDGVDFDGNDKFMLDGQRLVLASGQDEDNYGRNLAEYRTEQNSFRRITSYGGGEPESFIVHSKEGLIYYYGHRAEANSRVLASGVLDKIFYWLVDRIEDRNGNYILINYEAFEGATEYRPKSILYTGNDNPDARLKPYNLVEFNYRPRDDSQTRFIGGSKSSLSRVLNNISTYHSSFDATLKDNLVREYQFEYKPTSISKKNLLTGFRECTGSGGEKECLNPTTFKYLKEGKIEFNDVKPNTYQKRYSEDFKIFFGDLNKDGFQDKLLIRTSPSNLVIDYYLNDRKGGFPQAAITKTLPIKTKVDANIFLSDSDADGDADVSISYFKDKKWQTIFLQTVINSEGGIEFESKMSKETNINNEHKKFIQVVDLNGDGLIDPILYYYDDNDNILIHKLIQQEDDFHASDVENHPISAIPKNHPMNLTDLNSDGLTDFLFTWTNSSGWFTKAFLNESEKSGNTNFNFISIEGDNNESYRSENTKIEFVSDFEENPEETTQPENESPDEDESDSEENSDAETDDDNPPPVDTTIYTSKISSTTIAQGNYNDLKSITVLDYNSDNNPDLVLSLAKGKTWSVYLARGLGNGRFEKPQVQKLLELDDNKFLYNWNFTAGEFNGDGILDLVIYQSSSAGLTTYFANGIAKGEFDKANSENISLEGNFSYHESVNVKSLFCNTIREKYYNNPSVYDALAESLNLTREQFNNLPDEEKFKRLTANLFKSKNLLFPTGYHPNIEASPLEGELIQCESAAYEAHLKKNFERDLNYKRLQEITSVIKQDCPKSNKNSGSNNNRNKKCPFEGVAHFKFHDFWSLYSTDLNGDGITDLILTNPRQPKSSLNSPNPLEGNHKDFIWINKTSKSGLLNELKEGNNSKVEIEYLPLTNNSVYEIENEFQFPLLTVRGPIYNVKKTYSSTGIEGKKSMMAYKYFDGISSLNGRGFLGFRKVYKYHKDSKLHDWKAYFTDEYRIEGTGKSEYIEKGIRLLKFSKKYYGDQGNEVLIEEVTNEPAIKYLDPSKKSYLPYIKTAHEKKYDFNTSQVLAHRTSHFDFDENGNLEFTKVDHKLDEEIYFSEITQNEYEDNMEKWFLGRLVKTSVIKTDLDNTDTSIVTFNYDEQTGQLNEEKFIASNNLLQLTKSYEFDVYGNVTKSHLKGFASATDEQIRTTTTKYDGKGRFVIETEDALGYKTSASQNQLYGYTSTEIDVNGNKTEYTFDRFGNQKESINPIENWHKTSLKECDSCNYPNASHFKVDKYKLGPPTITYYDIFSRVIAVETFDYKGRKIISEQKYDHLGQITFKSPPYFENGEKQVINYEYDELGRISKSTYPNGKIERVEYHGLDIHKFDAADREHIEKKNSRGQVVQNIENSTEDVDDIITYKYDLRGNLTEIKDKHGNNTIVQKFDKNNNRIEVHNPNLENPFTTDFNAFGEILKETSPGGKVTNFEYDELGRLIKRNDPNSAVVRWKYIGSNSNNNGKGQLKSIRSNAIYTFNEDFEYDAFGRLTDHQYLRGGKNYNYEYGYDSETGLLSQEIIYGKLATITTNRIYSDGTLVEVRNNNDELYWKLEDTDHLQQITSFELGNGIKNSVKFEYNSNNLTHLKYSGTQTSLHYSYDYDLLDNIVLKKDEINGLQESFEYDRKDRLVQSNVVSGENSETNDIAYDNWNNIKTKSKNGNKIYDYVYSSAFPSRLESVNGRNISYDNEGNRKNGLDYNLSYNHFNKPNRITRGNTIIFNQYGPNGDKQLEITEHKKYKRKKYFVGGRLERTEEDKGMLARNKLVHERVYIVVNGQKLAHLDFRIEKKKTISTIRYNLFDSHGSLVITTDGEGRVKSSKNYDPWGLERDSKTWFHYETPKVLEVEKKSPNRFLISLGFQGHAMISTIGLIDMGGRFYDPVLSQFLSIDPINGIASNLGMNGYAYVLNNPLKYLDPSGYFFKKVFKGLGSIFSGIGNALGSVMREIGDFLDKNIVTIAIIAVGVATGGAAIAAYGAVAGSATAAVVGAAGFGFGAAFSGAIFSGASFGEALQAGITSAIISGAAVALTAGIGGADAFQLGSGQSSLTAGQTVAKAASHGAVQGTFQMMQGGKFEHGFMSGVFTEFASPGIIRIGENGFSFKRVAAAGMVGGTASSIGGGKFANGAVSGAIVQAFNSEAHRGDNLKEKIVKEEKYDRMFSRGLNNAEGPSISVNRNPFAPPINKHNARYLSPQYQLAKKLYSPYGLIFEIPRSETSLLLKFSTKATILMMKNYDPDINYPGPGPKY